MLPSQTGRTPRCATYAVSRSRRHHQSHCEDAGRLETTKCNLSDGKQSSILLSFQRSPLSVRRRWTVRRQKIHKANDQRADGLGAVRRSSVTHQGACQRAAFKRKQLSTRCLFALRTDTKPEQQDQHPRLSLAPAWAAPGSPSTRSPVPVCGPLGEGRGSSPHLSARSALAGLPCQHHWEKAEQRMCGICPCSAPEWAVTSPDTLSLTLAPAAFSELLSLFYTGQVKLPSKPFPTQHPAAL